MSRFSILLLLLPKSVYFVKVAQKII